MVESVNMFIYELKQQIKNKNRYNIYSEEGFVGALGVETIVKYALNKKDEISAENFKIIIQEDNEKYAFDKALKYLSYSARTQSDVVRYLKDRQVDEEAIKNTLKKLKNYGYIDDLEYAVQYAKERIRKEGKRAIEYKLRQKGIENEIIKEALASFSNEDERQAAFEIYALLSRKYKGEDENRKKMKIMRNMAAKGYDYDLIQSIICERED